MNTYSSDDVFRAAVNLARLGFEGTSDAAEMLMSFAHACKDPVAYLVVQKNRLSSGPMYRSREEAIASNVADWDIDEVIPLYAHPDQAD
jgi:hypothetical protein